MTPDHPTDSPSQAVRPRRRWRPAAVLVLAALAVGGLVWAGIGRRMTPEGPAQRPAEDPPLPVLSSPFLNTKPGVQYVGDRACAGCHRRLSKAYHAHAMGRSLAPVSPGDGLERYPARVEKSNLELSVGRRGPHVFHKVVYRDPAGKPIPGLAFEAEVRFAMGSGTQGRSYLIDRDGFLFQSPISWYSKAKTWDLSPSFRQLFHNTTRPVLSRCVFCHCNQATPVAGTLNRFERPLFRGLSIGCERCHGPGELHVALRRRGEDPGETDRTIVNPGRLEPALREAVCQQCHLQGSAAIVRRGRSLWDYRPGLPLQEFLAVFVKPPEKADHYRAVSHVEQLQVSRCVTASGGRLGCITCHGLHAEPRPADRVAHYRAACLKCHEGSACRLPPAERRRRSPEDSCVLCHMPRTASSNVAHTAITDHRIIRSPDRPPQPQSGLGPNDIPVLHFHRDLVRESDPEAGRDLGLAMMQMAEEQAARDVRRVIARRALPLLQQALLRAPGDLEALQAEGQALLFQGRPGEALEALTRVLARAPRGETALALATFSAEELRRLDAALDYAARLADVNPWDPGYQDLLARIQAKRGDWPAALATCRKALELDPASVQARSLLVAYHLDRGAREAAQAEFDRLLALSPPEIAELRRWYQKRTRRAAADDE
jgi:hypothetical protein